MLRAQFKEAQKNAMREKDKLALATVRLILAALKDRDIAARGKGVTDGISDEEILSMLQSMIKQRRDSIDQYTKGGRPELAEAEAAEIEVIQRFMPRQLSEEESLEAIDAVIKDIDATSIKDMGRTMNELKARYNGQMDFGKASKLIKDKLSA